MTEALTRKELARTLVGYVVDERLSARAATTQVEGEMIVQHLEEQIVEALLAGRPVMLAGFLKLERTERPARTGRNPRTGEPVQIARKRGVKVKVLKQLADRLNAD